MLTMVYVVRSRQLGGNNVRSREDRSVSSVITEGKVILETTDTILQHLQTHAPDNLTVYVDGTRYLVPVSALKLLAWNSVPPMIRDENSEEAKKSQLLRTGLKTLIRSHLSEIIEKSWGRKVKIVPRLNILNWLPRYLINILINAVAFMEWRIDVEKCESCQGDVYKVVGISPNTDHIIHSESLPATRSGNQPLQGRGEFDAPGAADSDESGRPVGVSGSASIWKVNFFEGTDRESEI